MFFKMIYTSKKYTWIGVLYLILFFGCAPAQNQVAHYNIKSLGAVADGKTLNTGIIQKYLDACSANGGGSLIFEPGTYRTGSLKIGKNTEIELKPGAVLLASPDLKDYGGNHFIHAINADNLMIKGQGSINGNGSYFINEDFTPKERPQPFIVISGNNISISGVTLTNSPAHVLALENCDLVRIDGISIKNDFRTPNTDGIDIISSKNVFISNCYISTGDDAICLKSKKDMDNAYATANQKKLEGIENVVVTNCILESDDTAIKLGTGSANITANCMFNNITIRNTRYGIGLFMMDGGQYRDIVFNNISIETNSRHQNHYGIFVDIHQREETSKVGTIHNIHFNNINITTEGLIYLSGHPQQNLGNIYFKDIVLNVPGARDTSKWNKPKGNKNIKQWTSCADYTQLPASVIFANIQGLDINGFKVLHAPGDRERYGFYLKNVSGESLQGLSGNPLNLQELIKKE